MAEINQSATNESATRKIRSKKGSSKVDLTAMVDLAFLLITFFMLTTTLSKPKAMDLALPDPKGIPSKVDENRTMTILIGTNNKLQCFMGKFEENKSKEISLESGQLRKELASNKLNVHKYATAIGHPERGLIVLIKPGKKSNYGNLVDVLDEMAITEVSTYAITDLESNESKFMERQSAN